MPASASSTAWTPKGIGRFGLPWPAGKPSTTNYDNDPGVAFASAGPVTGSAVTVTIGGGAASGLFLGATVTVPTTAFAGGYTAQIIGSTTYVQ